MSKTKYRKKQIKTKKITLSNSNLFKTKAYWSVYEILASELDPAGHKINGYGLILSYGH